MYPTCGLAKGEKSVNLLFHELIEAERRVDKLAEAAHYRLVKQAKKKDKTLSLPLLLISFGRLLEGWGNWLVERYAM
jgi:hypothetical protein